MCIRDSSTPSSQILPTSSWTWHSTPTFHTHTTCLLYTSDAADERSSVDLGGRRIIKKNVYFFFFKQKTAYEMLRSLVGSEMCIRDSSNTSNFFLDLAFNPHVSHPYNTAGTQIFSNILILTFCDKSPPFHNSLRPLKALIPSPTLCSISSFIPPPLPKSIPKYLKIFTSSNTTPPTRCLLYTSPSPRDS